MTCLKKKYAEPAPEVDHKSDENRTWYLPHHAVVHPKKNKLRVVESGAGLSLFIILPLEGSIDNGNFGTDDRINGIFSQ